MEKFISVQSNSEIVFYSNNYKECQQKYIQKVKLQLEKLVYKNNVCYSSLKTKDRGIAQPTEFLSTMRIFRSPLIAYRNIPHVHKKGYCACHFASFIFTEHTCGVFHCFWGE